MSNSKRPRISDVAKVAGVSDATVSVVLNGRVGENVRVSQGTQEKIWAAVHQLGYVANPVAQRLAGGQNHIVAVFTFESVFPMDVSSFYYPFLIGIEQQADLLGYDLLLVTGTSDPSSGKRRIYQNNINRLGRADGAILLGHGDKSEVSRLLQDGFPLVYVGRRELPHDDISYVGADYVQATHEIVRHIHDLGHCQLAYLQTTRQNEASRDRLVGYETACSDLGLQTSSEEIWSGETRELNHHVIADYLKKGITAFVVEDDTLGRRLLEIAEHLDIQCPGDFSFAVLGNPLNPVQEVPDWTTFSIPRREMGSEALQMLVHILESPRDASLLPQRKMLTCQFTKGATTGPIS